MSACYYLLSGDFRHFQDAKEYADELEKIFKALLEIRLVN